MAKCSVCGKKGLFIKINEDGVCKDCIRLAWIREEEKKTEFILNHLKDEVKAKEKVVSDTNIQIALLKANRNGLEREIHFHVLSEFDQDLTNRQQEMKDLLSLYQEKEKLVLGSENEVAKNQQSIEKLKAKILRFKDLYESIQYSIANSQLLNSNLEKEWKELLEPTVGIHLHYMDISDLRKLFMKNQEDIHAVQETYQSRYTTKANITIYKLMVLALEAEIQNILADLKYGKLEDGQENVRKMTRKYLEIATDGNQSIAPTVKSFIGQIESLFLKSVEIEYVYYTKKEKMKEEQKALREQMRQEAAERKALEEERIRIEKEESKYQKEIEALKGSLLSAEAEKQNALQERISQLEGMLQSVQDKKEDIVKLEHGKAGYVYIISNLGSFGDDVFKVGMTRRLDPQERIDELGSASVPFPFDVHSFIFSDDAVDLEYKLHSVLNTRRVNKVNMRKEFFRVSVDDIEKYVTEYDPTAEFKRTMIAEQYRQSQSVQDDFVFNLEKEIVDEIDEEKGIS